MRKKKLITYLIMVVSLVVAVKMVRDIYSLWHTEDRLIEAEAELVEAQKEKQQLEQELTQAEGQEWWERQARDKLMMARPEETVVVVPEEVTSLSENETEKEAVRGEEELRPWQQWWNLFMIEY